MTISPLQLARVSDLMSSLVTTGQLNSTQQQLLTVEQQISTGNQFSQPSDNPGATAITMQLQRTLTQRTTYSTNLSSAQSQLGQVDNSLSSLESLVQQAQSIASADVNSDVTDSQRQADAQIVDSIYNQALSISNTQFNGLYLFGGDKNTNPPYVAANGGVQFVGSTQTLQTAVDANTNVSFMVNPADVFGATSSQVQGSVDLTPNLTAADAHLRSSRRNRRRRATRVDPDQQWVDFADRRSVEGQHGRRRGECDQRRGRRRDRRVDQRARTHAFRRRRPTTSR